MSKITIITASPRKDGNSLQMAGWFAEEAERLGAIKDTDAEQKVKALAQKYVK